MSRESWFGPASEVEEALRDRANVGMDGSVMIRNGSVFAGIGGQEVIISEGTEFMDKDGQWREIIPLLGNGIAVKVF